MSSIRVGNIAQMFQQGQQFSQEQRKQKTLRDFLQPALGGDQDALSQVYGAAPEMGMQVQQHATQQQDSQRKMRNEQLEQMASMIARGGEPIARQLYPQFSKLASETFGLPATPDYDPQVIDFAKTIVGDEEMPAGVREFQAMTQGMSPEEVEKARRVSLGLAPRAAQPGQPTIKQSDDGRLFLVTEQGYREIGPAEAQAAGGPTGGASMVLDDALSNAVMMQESGGDPNAVSPKGARGLMQIMPGTARDPGFGIAPMRDESPQENVRVGREYLSAMLQRYNGDQQLALAAYNAGPGRVDEALRAAGGNPQAALARLPAETRNYVPSVQRRMGQGGAPTFGKKQAAEGAQEKFGQPQEVVDPRTGKPTLVQFGDRGSVRPVQGYGSKPPAKPESPQAQPVKAAQVKHVDNGLARIEQALKGLEGGIVNTGPLDQYVVGMTPRGQELKAAVGAIQDSLLALTRVPGVGAQSDLEAKIAALKYPSLEMAPEVNRETMKQLRAFVAELKGALQGGQAAPAQAAPQPGGWSIRRK